ncbi:MAG: hypothetical protein AAB553_03270 [Patescibacteria group bacterium]
MTTPERRHSHRAIEPNTLSSGSASVVSYFMGAIDPLAREFHVVSRRLLPIKGAEEGNVQKGAPIQEIRFKLVSHVLDVANTKQVVEYASGSSLQGHSRTQKDPGTIYVECELPERARHKKDVFAELAATGVITGTSPNLYIEAANALDKSSIKDVKRRYINPAKPTVDIALGLLHYYERAGKEQFLAGVRTTMKAGDMLLMDTPLLAPEGPTLSQMVSGKIAGIDVNETYFKSLVEADELYRSFGFVPTRLNYGLAADILDLVSPELLGVSLDDIKEQNKYQWLYILTIP